MSNSSNIYGKIFKEILTNEKLDPKKHDAGDYIKDFQKSKAPQFKGKSKKKKREMAIAAHLAAKEEDDNTVGGGALGPAAAVGHRQGDFYATGDYRVPKALGAIQTRSGTIGGTNKRRKKKKKK